MRFLRALGDWLFGTYVDPRLCDFPNLTNDEDER